MDQENQKETYLTLLEYTLNKKNDVLEQLIELSFEQEALINKSTIDDNLFDQNLDKKEEQIKILLQLDEGFDQLYQRIQEELLINKDKYKNQILRLQDLIKVITDKGVQLQVIEKRNKTKMEAYLLTKRKEIKSFKVNSKSVASYYKNMNGQEQQESYFFDKKK